MSKRGPAKKLAATTHFTITVISGRGEPLEPKKAAHSFTKQCGFMVRDRIPITVREWNKTKKARESQYVAERYKEGLWNDLMAHFTPPKCETQDNTDALRLKVKE